ncbi:MAG: hypothetical protein SFV21_08465, partial [Rhodospirillaceae bacterium]|nr:hypothetical protein [Rhodospirillaceae bacterium]
MARFDAARHPALAQAVRTRMAELDPSFTADRSDVGPDVVVPAWVHTLDLLRRFVAGQVAQGVDPARIRLPNAAERAAAEQDASINPATGMEEFGLWSSVKGLFGGRGDRPAPAAGVSPSTARPAPPPQIDPITIAGQRNTERLGPPAGIERIAASGPSAPRFVPAPHELNLSTSWDVTRRHSNLPVYYPVP